MFILIVIDYAQGTRAVCKAVAARGAVRSGDAEVRCEVVAEDLASGW